jgi:hypothetical protein
MNSSARGCGSTGLNGIGPGSMTRASVSPMSTSAAGAPSNVRSPENNAFASGSVAAPNNVMAASISVRLRGCSRVKPHAAAVWPHR